MKNYLDNSQDQIQIINNGETYRAYCITKKGGALYFKYRNKFFFDYGWDIIFNKNLFTTYWQSSFWSYKKQALVEQHRCKSGRKSQNLP